MAAEQHPVGLISVAEGSSQGVFIVNEDDDEDACHLTLQYTAGKITTRASDYFEAMCQIRLELEKTGWRPVCFGSSRNVYPSGMCRDMGRGLKAYKLQLGHPAKLEDLVGIFESGPDVEPTSVDEQRHFFDRWLQSLAGDK